ncbi:MAG: hypothetical protein ACYTAF_04750 [Planctomycetota bacterium]|jgi:hypothetical protein
MRGIPAFLAGLVVGLAILSIVLLSRRQEPPPVPAEPVAAEQAAPAPGASEVEKKIGKLEERLARLEEENKLLEERLEEAKRAPERREEEGGPPPDFSVVRRKGARGAAELLGLDESRGDLLHEAYEDVLGRLRGLEADKADVDVEGDTTTITIPRFEDEGGALAAEWEQHLKTILTAEERAKFTAYNMGRGLFPWGFGQFGRTVTLKQSDEGYHLEDRGKTAGGMNMDMAVAGPPEELDGALTPYRHLLED